MPREPHRLPLHDEVPEPLARLREQVLPREFLYVADELFFCGTAAEITPIRSVDRFPIGDGKPGPITMKLREQLLGIQQGTFADTHDWMTVIG